MDTMHVRSIYNFKQDSLLQNNLLDTDTAQQKSMELQLKSQIQNYADALLNNKMSVQ
jgi:hypothetical protein